MKRLFSLLSLLASLSFAQGQTFIANLDGLQDGGGGRTGSGIFNLTLTGTTLTFSGSFSGLSGTFSDAHIHGPAAAGVSTSVMYPMASFITLDAGNKSGTLNGSVNLVAGTRGFDIATQISQLNSGLWYYNVHSSTFTGGEIRGQLLPVPEPSTIALLGLGLGGLVLTMVRRKR
jgi:hypothetical protein